MTGFANTSELVKDILTNNEASRNSDNLLFYLVCKPLLAEQGVEVDKVGFAELFLSLKEYGLPQYETVGRIRRKLQQEFPELICSSEVGLNRSMIEDSFKDFAKDGE